MSKPANAPAYADLAGEECDRIAFDNTIGAYSTIDGFITQKVGRKVVMEAIDTVTDDFHYYQGASLLWTVRVVYTDTTKNFLLSAERTA